MGPLESSSIAFRKRGIVIGDVGIITSGGAFKFAFNIFTPRSNSEINHFGVPDGFHPLPMDQRDVERNIDKHAKGSEIFGCVEKEGTSAGGGQNGFNYSAPTAANGSVPPVYSSEQVSLVLPDGASGEDYRNSADICNYIMTYALLWHRFINSKVLSDDEMPNSSFYVVTGCDKTSCWAITTRDSSQNQAASSKTSSTRSSTTAEPSGGGTKPSNNCVFIRGYKVTVREEAAQSASSGPAGVKPKAGSSKVADGLPGRKNGRKFTARFFGRGGTQREEPGGAKPDPQITYLNPVDIINRYLLQEMPKAQFAITHEHDWWSLTQDDNLADEAEIIERLFDHYTLLRVSESNGNDVASPLTQVQPVLNTNGFRDDPGLYGIGLVRGDVASPEPFYTERSEESQIADGPEDIAIQPDSFSISPPSRRQGEPIYNSVASLLSTSPQSTPTLRARGNNHPAPAAPAVNYSTRPNRPILSPLSERDTARAEKLAKLDVSGRVEITKGHAGVLGYGRYGPIYHGLYRRSSGEQTPVAVRTLSCAPHDRSRVEERFYREIYKWKQVSQHENVAEFVGIVKTPHDPPYVVSLLYKNILLEYSSIHTELRLQLAKDIARGLDSIHGNDIVHGNLKAENVVVLKSGHAQIAGFGIASIPGILGSTNTDIRHTAPELLPSNRHVAVEPTKEGDVFSLGILLLQLFDGHADSLPYNHVPSHEHEILHRAILEREERPRRGNYGFISDNRWSLIESCWATNPASRPKVVQTASQVYVRHLLPKKYGYPLYCPEPLESLPSEYRQRGTSIGDVGFIKLNGSFVFAFNIFTPQTETALNKFGVPDGFYPLHLNQQDIVYVDDKFAKGSEILCVEEDGIIVDISAGDGSDPSVTHSATGAASLVLPDGATGQDYRNHQIVRDYLMANATSWYHFVHVTLGHEVTNGSLYVVTGCDKSSSWRITTVGEQSPSLLPSSQLDDFDAVVRESTPTSGSRAAKQLQNQCLFLRGYKIMFREGFPALASVSSTLDSLMASSLPPRKKSRRPTWMNFRAGTPREVIAKPKPEPHIVYDHPVDSINRYLLEKLPQAQFSITHESEWWPISPDGTLAIEEQVLRNVLVHYTLSIEFEQASNSPAPYYTQSSAQASVNETGSGSFGDVGTKAVATLEPLQTGMGEDLQAAADETIGSLHPTSTLHEGSYNMPAWPERQEEHVNHPVQTPEPRSSTSGLSSGTGNNQPGNLLLLIDLTTIPVPEQTPRPNIYEADPLSQSQNHSVTRAERLANLDVTGRVEFAQGDARVLGHGRYGTVYHGRYTRRSGEQIDVAIKVLKCAPQDKNRIEEHFMREIYRWRQVSQHENVAEFIGIMRTPHDPPYVVSAAYNANFLAHAASHIDLQLQLVGHCSLFLTLATRIEKWFQAKDIARGLDAIHGNGIIHGNLKPGNVAISNTGRAQVADFGVASVPGIQGSSSRNVRHSAPELLPLNASVWGEPTKESDIFSLGILFLQLFNCQADTLPYNHVPLTQDDLNDNQLRRRIHEQEDRPRRERYSPVSDYRWALLEKCWDSNPASRPNIAQVRKRLV
ncbi:hypothetical protein HWV62_15933 [Athelia sp. TMB]|nr:hypothetical protein HWV62_15933 [Athelia sp. TMB]